MVDWLGVRASRVGLVALLSAGTVGLVPPAPPATAATPAPRSTAPDTSGCPHRERPEAAADTSEVVAPGSSTPIPPPAPSKPAGGQKMAECGIVAEDGFVVPDILASAWIVYDLDSGEVFATKDPHGRYRPASVIKGLLALEVAERLKLDDPAPVSLDSAEAEGSAVGIHPEGTYTVRDLLNGLLLASGNDAAHALAQLLGGDADTLKAINARARSLGTQDTYAATYSGLDAPGMQTSAYDLALIYQQVFSNEALLPIFATDHVDFPGWGDRPGYELWNDNGLLYNTEGGFAGKTGYTDDARHTFAGAVERDGRRIAAIVLDTTVDKGRAWEQAEALIDAVYATPEGSEPVGSVRNSLKPADGQDSVREVTSPTRDADAHSTGLGSGVVTGTLALSLTALAVLVVAGVAFAVRRR